MWRPAPGRRHDAYLVRESEINTRLAYEQLGSASQGKVYGDAAYPIMSHIDRGYRGAVLTATQRVSCDTIVVRIEAYVDT